MPNHFLNDRLIVAGVKHDCPPSVCQFQPLGLREVVYTTLDLDKVVKSLNLDPTDAVKNARKAVTSVVRMEWSNGAFMSLCARDHLSLLYDLQKPFYMQYDDSLSRESVRLTPVEGNVRAYYTPTFPIYPPGWNPANRIDWSEALVRNYRYVDPANFEVDSRLGIVLFNFDTFRDDLIDLSYTCRIYCRIAEIDLNPLVGVFLGGRRAYEGTVVFEQVPTPEGAIDLWDVKLPCRPCPEEAEGNGYKGNEGGLEDPVEPPGWSCQCDRVTITLNGTLEKVSETTHDYVWTITEDVPENVFIDEMRVKTPLSGRSYHRRGDERVSFKIWVANGGTDQEDLARPFGSFDVDKATNEWFTVPDWRNFAFNGWIYWPRRQNQVDEFTNVPFKFNVFYRWHNEDANPGFTRRGDGDYWDLPGYFHNPTEEYSASWTLTRYSETVSFSGTGQGSGSWNRFGLIQGVSFNIVQHDSGGFGEPFNLIGLGFMGTGTYKRKFKDDVTGIPAPAYARTSISTGHRVTAHGVDPPKLDEEQTLLYPGPVPVGANGWISATERVPSGGHAGNDMPVTGGSFVTGSMAIFASGEGVQWFPHLDDPSLNVTLKCRLLCEADDVPTETYLDSVRLSGDPGSSGGSITLVCAPSANRTLDFSEFEFYKGNDLVTHYGEPVTGGLIRFKAKTLSGEKTIRLVVYRNGDVPATDSFVEVTLNTTLREFSVGAFYHPTWYRNFTTVSDLQRLVLRVYNLNGGVDGETYYFEGLRTKAYFPGAYT